MTAQVKIMGAIAFAIAVSLTVQCGRHTKADQLGDAKTSVVWVLVDALRWDRLGCTGYERDVSPNIDRMARDGTVFMNCWAQAPQTFHSTATMLTGTYFPKYITDPSIDDIPELPERTKKKLLEDVPIVAEENILVSEVFSEAGYRTYAGFTNPHHHSASGFRQGFDVAEHLGAGDRGYEDGSVVLSRFSAWLGQEPSDRPFFAYLHFMDVHNPYEPPEPFRTRFLESDGVDRYVNGVPKPEARPSQEDLEYMSDLYDGGIAYIDHLLHRLVSEILGRVEGPLVIVISSDHGDEFMEHGGLGHGRTLEPEMLHVPLVFVGLQKPTNRGKYNLVRNIDIAPTLLVAAGLQVPELYQGYSTIGDQSATGHSPWIHYSFGYKGGLRSVTTDRWHLMHLLKPDRHVMYDHRADPLGRVDQSSGNRDQVQLLSQVLGEFSLAASDWKRRNEAAQAKDAEELKGNLDPEVVRQLEALGYLGESSDEKEAP